MTHLVFVVDMPQPGISTDDPEAATRWFDFVGKASKVPMPEKGMQLGCKNVWIFPVAKGADTLHKLQTIAKESGLSYSTYNFVGMVTEM